MSSGFLNANLLETKRRGLTSTQKTACRKIKTLDAESLDGSDK